MEYKSIREMADEWGISKRRIQVLCVQNRIEGAVRIGYSWAMDKVILRDENGIEIDMAISDSTLYDKDINEGDWVYFDPNNQIFKEN